MPPTTLKLQLTEIEFICVTEEIGKIKELWDEFLEVTTTLETMVPRLTDIVEQSISVIKLTSLKISSVPRERLQTEKEEEDTPYVTIVGSVEKLGDDFILEAMIPIKESRQSLLIQSSDGFRKISESLGVVEIQFGACVICNNPRENRILCQVIVGSPSSCVECH
jgi:hypothetical protein